MKRIAALLIALMVKLNLSPHCALTLAAWAEIGIPLVSFQAAAEIPSEARARIHTDTISLANGGLRSFPELVASLVANRPVKRNRHSFFRSVNEQRIRDIGHVEAVAARLRKKRVAARAEIANLIVPLIGVHVHIYELEALRYGGLAAPDSRAGAITEITLFVANRGARANEILPKLT